MILVVLLNFLVTPKKLDFFNDFKFKKGEMDISVSLE